MPLLVLLLLLAACGDDTPAPAAAASNPARAATPAAGQATGLEGRWYIFLPARPWISFYVEVRPTAEGPRAKWGTFDWTASADSEHLAQSSKLVDVVVEGDVLALTLTGPSPMLTADGRPNGQSGEWTIKLIAPKDGPARLTGTATHESYTDGRGTPAEMTRDWRGRP